MTKEKLNKLAVLAQEGSTDACDEILEYYVPRIEGMARQVWYLLDNEAAFISYCQGLVKAAIRKHDAERGGFDRQVRMRLRDAMRFFVKDRSKKRRSLGLVDLDMFALRKEDGTLEYGFKDDLASVESVCLVKEKIALLAKGDSRKEAILLAWSDGLYNDSALSVLLAQRFGGKPESHRQAIKRFRAYCQVSLEGIA